MKVEPPQVGTPVHSRAFDQDGVVVSVYGDLATVRFPSGDRTVPLYTLETRVVDPLQLISTGRFPDQPEWFDIRLRAARLQAAYGSDNLSGLVNSRVMLRAHQVFVAHRILEKPRPSMIVADEVGLGKTIEAGLVLKELLARKSVARILVIVPPNLLNQWATELRIKFNELFEIVDSALLQRTKQLYPGRNPWSRFNRVLVSSYLARSEDNRRELVEAGWELVIVDEAHHCRRKLVGASIETTQLYRTVDELKDSAFGMLLLTATPMQLHPFELFSLVEIVEPGLYQDDEDFYEEMFSSLDLKWAVRVLQSWNDSGQQARGQALETLAKHGIEVDVDSPVAREEATDSLLQRSRLVQAIVRNRKRTVGGFTQRRAKTYRLKLSAEELEVHQLLEDYLRHGFDAARQRRDRLFGLELVTFQRLIASSSRALARALEGRRRRLRGEAERGTPLTDELEEDDKESTTLALRSISDEIRALDYLIAALRELRDTKALALVGLVRRLLEKDPTEKIIIFTQFLATQDLLVELLRGDFTVALFRGALSRWDKDQAVNQFRESAQIMVSTEAGGEGRNFQFCHILINYDLHWNPMRIEQRIGRLDRYGQKRNVHVYNLTVEGTVEDRLVEVLERRLNLFEAAVGALELMLGEVEEDIRNALLTAAGNINEAAMIFERDLDLRLRDAQQIEEKSADFLIELGSFRRDVAERLTGELEEGRLRRELELLVLNLLSLFPSARVTPEGEVLQIVVPPALPRSLGRELEPTYRGTFSAPLAVEDERLEFFGFGHPLVDACLAYAASDNPAGLVTVRSLPQARLSQPVIELNFLLEFSGVRKWAQVESMVFSLGGRRERHVEELLYLAEPANAPSVAPDLSALEPIRLRAIDELQHLIEEERPRLIKINEQRAKEEAQRAERIHRYNIRRLEDKQAGVRENIQRIELEGTVEQKRILPALRGQVDAVDREKEVLAGELVAKLRDLETLKDVSESLQLINAALIVPANTRNPNELATINEG